MTQTQEHEENHGRIFTVLASTCYFQIHAICHKPNQRLSLISEEGEYSPRRDQGYDVRRDPELCPSIDSL